MPRRRDPDDEDTMITCPQCKGQGNIYLPSNDNTLGTNIECPLCLGEGRVTRLVYLTYNTASTDNNN